MWLNCNLTWITYGTPFLGVFSSWLVSILPHNNHTLSGWRIHGCPAFRGQLDAKPPGGAHLLRRQKAQRCGSSHLAKSRSPGLGSSTSWRDQLNTVQIVPLYNWILCMCIYTYICIYICIYIYVYIYIYVCMYISLYVYLSICIFMCIYIYVYM